MSRFLWLLVFCFYVSNLNSQEIIFEKDITLNNCPQSKGFTATAINNKGAIIINHVYKRNIESLVISNNYQSINKYSFLAQVGNLNFFLGQSIDSIGSHLFFTNANKNRFRLKSIDVLNNRITDFILPIKLKNEKLLGSFSYQSKFYLLTVKKVSSILNVHIFDGTKSLGVKTFDLSDSKFAKSGYTKLYDVLLGQNLSIRVQNINPEVSNDLTLTARIKKVYFWENKIYISLDNDIENTKLITIDLNTFTSSVKFFLQPYVYCKDTNSLNSNSYLYKNILFQLKGNKDEFSITALNLASDSIIREFRFERDKEISIMNTPVTLQVQTSGATIFPTDLKNELKEVPEAMKRIFARYIGISAFQLGDKVELTVGGTNNNNMYETDNIGFSFSINAQNPIVTSSRNISPKQLASWEYGAKVFGYGKYCNATSFYFKTVLTNNNLEHIDGDISRNAYEKIRIFRSRNFDVFAETVFKVDDYYLYGYYNKKEKKYYLRKFTD